MDFDHTIYLLSSDFITDYPPTKYPELMHKQGRPYTCLLIDSHDGYFICVPFRSSIHHKNAFLFKSTLRSRRTSSGLDYTKMVLIEDSRYIDSSHPAIVDSDEYHELLLHLPQIVSEVIEYVDCYVNHINGKSPLHPREFLRKYQYSTLAYFHDILGLPFEVTTDMPNQETVSAMLEAERIAQDSSVKGYTDVDELFADLKK